MSEALRSKKNHLRIATVGAVLSAVALSGCGQDAEAISSQPPKVEAGQAKTDQPSNGNIISPYLDPDGNELIIDKQGVPLTDSEIQAGKEGRTVMVEEGICRDDDPSTPPYLIAGETEQDRADIYIYRQNKLAAIDGRDKIAPGTDVIDKISPSVSEMQDGASFNCTLPDEAIFFVNGEKVIGVDALVETLPTVTMKPEYRNQFGDFDKDVAPQLIAHEFINSLNFVEKIARDRQLYKDTRFYMSQTGIVNGAYNETFTTDTAARVYFDPEIESPSDAESRQELFNMIDSRGVFANLNTSDAEYEADANEDYFTIDESWGNNGVDFVANSYTVSKQKGNFDGSAIVKVILADNTEKYMGIKIKFPEAEDGNLTFTYRDMTDDVTTFEQETADTSVEMKSVKRAILTNLLTDTM